MTDYRQKAETAFIKNLINDTYPKGIISYVADSFDFFRVITECLPKLKNDILKRDGKLVIRPDSGDPVKIICGEHIEIIPDDLSEEQAQDWATEYLSDRENEETEFARHGDGEPWGIFLYKGKYYKATAEIFWNRYDKTYYYQDGAKIKSWEGTTLTPEEKGAVVCLWEVFGGTITGENYKVLDSHIGLIYGDSITLQRAEAIMKGLKAKGFASCNVVFGIGSYTYEHVTRDTYGFAVKSTYGEVNNIPQEIFKDPITDNGVKKSAKGLLRVNEDFTLSDQQTWEQEKTGLLEIVFEDGKITKETSLSKIRELLNQ